MSVAAGLMMLPAVSLTAQEQGTAVVVIGKDGSRHEVMISDVDRIEFGELSFTLHRIAPEPCSAHAYADIDRILIGADRASVSDLTAGGNIAVWPTAVESTLNVAGTEPGTHIAVYDLGGALAASARTTADTASLDLSALTPGVYVVAVGKHTVKIIKK